MPEFYMIFDRKMSEYYMVIARKIFSPIFLGGRGEVGGGSVPSPKAHPQAVIFIAISLLQTNGTRSNNI